MAARARVGVVGGGAGRAAGLGWGTFWSHGNVGMVSEELQTFPSKERARREFVGKEWGPWEKNREVCILWEKSEFLWEKKIVSSGCHCLPVLLGYLQELQKSTKFALTLT